jgi:hypothetical protein
MSTPLAWAARIKALVVFMAKPGHGRRRLELQTLGETTTPFPEGSDFMSRSYSFASTLVYFQ